MRRGPRVIAGLLAAALASAPGLARATPVEPLTPPSPGPRAIGSLTYVTGFHQLAALTVDDDPLHQRVLAAQSRVWTGASVLIASTIVGALLVVGSATVLKQTECTTPSVPAGFNLPVDPICHSQPNMLVMAGGMLTMAIGGGTGVVMMRSQTEWYDIINEWNARHPERTLLVAPTRGAWH